MVKKNIAGGIGPDLEVCTMSARIMSTLRTAGKCNSKCDRKECVPRDGMHGTASLPLKQTPPGEPPVCALSTQTGSAGASPSRLLLSSADQRDWFTLSHFELHPMAANPRQEAEHGSKARHF